MGRRPDVPPEALRSLLRDVFGPTSEVSFERTAEGVACPTYQLRRDGDIFYLRVAEEPGQDLQADAAVHGHLRAIGVRVPEVVHVDAHAEALDRSVLVMREVPGIPLAEERDPAAARRIVCDAAEDVARMNAIDVSGFGWLQRTGPTWPPRAVLGDHASFVTSDLPDGSTVRRALVGDLLRGDHHDDVEALIAEELRRSLARSRLTHGDLDVTAIYCLDGRYTGLIDFSELRGAESTFDLGHFLLHDGETNPVSLFADFHSAYAGTPRRDAALDEQVRRSAVLLGYRQLCRWLAPDRGLPPTSALAELRAAQLANLLEGRPAATRR